MAHSFADFYRGKRVLVSGHTGFAGGWLTAWLKLLGAQVCGYGSPPSTRPNFFDATLLDRGMTSIFGDLRDREALANLFAEFQPEIVIHYAAQISAKRARLDPVEAFATHVMGTVHILEEVRLIDSVRSGDDPNSSSAAGAELAVSAYIGEFFHASRTAVATARSGSVIGGGDWADGELVPDVVRGIISAEPITIKHGSSVRPWQHVLEPVYAHLLLAQKLYEQGQELSGAWNFGPQEEDAISARQLADNFVKHWGAGKLVFGPDEAPTQPVLRLNTQKAQTRLDWKPALHIDEAIAWTVEWYKGFYDDPASSWSTTEDQIQRFMRCCGT
jgi:CDP-glucose 4,6-dehydratase